jgi:hypothetical protein
LAVWVMLMAEVTCLMSGVKYLTSYVLLLLWIRCQEIFGSKNHFWLVKPYSKPHAST